MTTTTSTTVSTSISTTISTSTTTLEASSKTSTTTTSSSTTSTSTTTTTTSEVSAETSSTTTSTTSSSTSITTLEASSETSTTSTSEASAETSSAATSTTITSAMCSSGNSPWNTTGITLLSSSTRLSCTRLFIDPNDTLYGADKDRHYVWKLLKNAENATVVAGVYGSSGSDNVKLNYPEDVYVDQYGKQLYYPRGFAFDPTDTFMYIADRSNNRVVRFLTNSTSDTNGVLAAGTGTPDNTNETLNSPWSIWYSSSKHNDLFIVNHEGHSVIRWTLGATSGTFVGGLPGISCSNSTCFSYPTDVRIDADLNMYVVDEGNHRVQMFCENSDVGMTVIGNGVAGDSSTQLNSPQGIAFDSAMNMYVCDTGNRRVQKFLKL
ncbi:unnamed protein product [Adineta steineri]|uniref:NHL repeat containing protein-like protein n=1 Tax=Adineta steineri TaxID=433720 RepID=A0A819THZ0_9BILA|nr:unnamed protein product [Adineta steineri]CAF4080180.1 unnamed protein product [Adineta steineri]